MIRLAAAVFREGRFQQSAPQVTEIVEQKAMVADMRIPLEVDKEARHPIEFLRRAPYGRRC